MKKAALTMIAGFVAAFTFAQTGGINGKLVDNFGEPFAFAHVWVEVSGEKIITTSDINGRFTVAGLNSGTYDLYATSAEFPNYTLSGIKVTKETNYLGDLVMGENLLGEIIIDDWIEPLVDIGNPTEIKMTSVEIDNNANEKNFLALLSSMSSDIVVLEGTNDVVVRGGRPGAMLYFIDGVKQTGSLEGVIGGSIQNISAYAGGIPAKYGDTTSGVIAVETKSYFDLYQEWNGKIKYDDAEAEEEVEDEIEVIN